MSAQNIIVWKGIEPVGRKALPVTSMVADLTNMERPSPHHLLLAALGRRPVVRRHF